MIRDSSVHKNMPAASPKRIQKRIELASGNYIETWYDRHTRSWVSQLKDREGNQIGNAQYDGHRGAVTASQEYLKTEATSWFNRTLSEEIPS